MLNIEYRESYDDELGEVIDCEFNKYAVKNGLICDFTTFCFVADHDGETAGVLTGHTYYNEVHISDLIVTEKHRGKGIGSKLVLAVEERYKDKGFDNISLTTYEFQAPEFYKKLGYVAEFVRPDSTNPKLTKYFLIKQLN